MFGNLQNMFRRVEAMQTHVSRKLWAIGGGKGGIGKSVFTLGLAISLARLGKKLILVDGDLGGANLHTLMGVRYPPPHHGRFPPQTGEPPGGHHH
jgi:Mrp family chromosome partitioning ATPase